MHSTADLYLTPTLIPNLIKQQGHSNDCKLLILRSSGGKLRGGVAGGKLSTRVVTHINDTKSSETSRQVHDMHCQEVARSLQAL